MAETSGFAPRLIREAMIRSLPWEASSNEAPEPRFVYVPALHARALQFDASLVVGNRGAGKSLWFNALRSSEHRKVIERSIEELGARIDWNERTKTSSGFGSRNELAEYPDRDTLRAAAQDVKDYRLIWRTIMAWQTWGKEGDLPTEWISRARWIAQHPEETAARFQHYDADLVKTARRHLVLFDALDRAGDDWSERRVLLRGLLQTLLDFRGYRAIRAKAFLRPDMLGDDVSAFPDASKVLATKVELRWEVKDLFGLLWQYLGNDEGFGADFRAGSSADTWTSVDGSGQTAYIPPYPLRFNKDVQERVFHKIAGARLRTGKRLSPYRWLPGHLADTHGQVSPRSFLIALRAAAEESTRRAEHPFAFDEGSLEAGVQKASSSRVEEVREDYPWVSVVLDPLRGLVIPCEFQQIEGMWKEDAVLEKLERATQHLPKHLSEGYRGLYKDLEELGFLVTLEASRGKRVNVPEVYRVGFGLKRRGGTKPVA